MNQFFTKKMAATSCIIMNTFLLLIHIGLFVFFCLLSHQIYVYLQCIQYGILCMWIFFCLERNAVAVFSACGSRGYAAYGAGNDLPWVRLWLSVMSARYGSCIFLWKLFFHAGTEEESTWNISGNTEHDIVYCGLCKGVFQRTALCD